MIMSDSSYSYAIYQLKRDDEQRDIRFMPYSVLEAKGLKPEFANYYSVYTGVIDEGAESESAVLAKLFYIFNMERPSDFTGHSLSVSDVVVLRRNEVTSAYYADSFGSQALPDFMDAEGGAGC